MAQLLVKSLFKFLSATSLAHFMPGLGLFKSLVLVAALAHFVDQILDEMWPFSDIFFRPVHLLLRVMTAVQFLGLGLLVIFAIICPE
jgi:hypothetical protein